MSLRNLIMESALEEAKSFAELPSAWKKVATRKKGGGAGSEVESVAARGSIKDVRLFESTLKKAIKSAKNYEITWVEFNGKELLAVIHEASEYSPRDPAYSIVLANGAMKEIENSVKAGWSGKWERRGGKQTWIPPTYHKYKTTKMSADQAFYRSLDIFREMAIAAAFGTELNPDAIGYKDKEAALEALVVGGKIEVKGLLPDVNRAMVQDQRKDARSGRGSADQADKRAVIKKVLVSKIESARKKFEDALPNINTLDALIDKAVQGKFDSRKDSLRTGDLSEIEAILSEINTALLHASGVASGTYLDKRIKFSDRVFAGDKASATFSAKNLMNK